MAAYKIFGAGPGGLYLAWRLASSGRLSAADSIELVEWGAYRFPGLDGTRAPAGRICTYHHNDDPDQSYIELGGMRFIDWAPNEKTGKYEGHQLVSKTISELGLRPSVIPFNTTEDPLLYLRGRNFYQSNIGKPGPDGQPFAAPYNNLPGNLKPASDLFNAVSQSITADQYPSRRDQCRFYRDGVLPAGFKSTVYRAGDTAGNISYWNIFYDQAGNEGYDYASDAGGYTSNVISWNAADAAIYNGEFAPGGSYKTLSNGYSTLFEQLYVAARDAAQAQGIGFALTPSCRLHSIWLDGQGGISYRTATADNPYAGGGPVQTADYAFLAMPPRAIDLVAQATRYQDMAPGCDFLNDQGVQNYLHSVVLQPSYKVAMFFDRPWWETTPYPPKLSNEPGAPPNVFGPTITDIPLRQIYYFGNNARSSETGGAARYGLLASYDDMDFTQFWQEIQLDVTQRRTLALSQNLQPLHAPCHASPTMVRMLLAELAKVHYGRFEKAAEIPAPLETALVDWGLNPFGAGYHAWASHYDITDVMQRIRAPGRLAGNLTSNVFITGSAFSNDQGWVEGAFCTAESVLVDFLQLPCIIPDTKDYPLICCRDDG